MIQMFNAQKLKLTACALTGLMTFGLVGMTASAAEASSHRTSHRYEEPAPRHHRHHDERRESKNTHSQGEVNTAAIAGVVVGAIAGAVIANNT
jgi:hypothetical protein